MEATMLPPVPRAHPLTSQVGTATATATATATEDAIPTVSSVHNPVNHAMAAPTTTTPTDNANKNNSTTIDLTLPPPPPPDTHTNTNTNTVTVNTPIVPLTTTPTTTSPSPIQRLKSIPQQKFLTTRRNREFLLGLLLIIEEVMKFEDLQSTRHENRLWKIIMEAFFHHCSIGKEYRMFKAKDRPERNFKSLVIEKIWPNMIKECTETPLQHLDRTHILGSTQYEAYQRYLQRLHKKNTGEDVVVGKDTLVIPIGSSRISSSQSKQDTATMKLSYVITAANRARQHLKIQKQILQGDDDDDGNDDDHDNDDNDDNDNDNNEDDSENDGHMESARRKSANNNTHNNNNNTHNTHNNNNNNTHNTHNNNNNNHNHNNNNNNNTAVTTTTTTTADSHSFMAAIPTTTAPPPAATTTTATTAAAAQISTTSVKRKYSTNNQPDLTPDTARANRVAAATSVLPPSPSSLVPTIPLPLPTPHTTHYPTLPTTHPPPPPPLRRPHYHTTTTTHYHDSSSEEEDDQDVVEIVGQSQPPLQPPPPHHHYPQERSTRTRQRSESSSTTTTTLPYQTKQKRRHGKKKKKKTYKHDDDDDCLTLHVGGTFFPTSKKTLCDHSLYFRTKITAERAAASSAAAGAVAGTRNVQFQVRQHDAMGFVNNSSHAPAAKVAKSHANTAAATAAAAAAAVAHAKAQERALWSQQQQQQQQQQAMAQHTTTTTTTPHVVGGGSSSSSSSILNNPPTAQEEDTLLPSYIHQDPEAFQILWKFMRDGYIYSHDITHRVLMQAEYFGMTKLVQAVKCAYRPMPFHNNNNNNNNNSNNGSIPQELNTTSVYGGGTSLVEHISQAFDKAYGGGIVSAIQRGILPSQFEPKEYAHLVIDKNQLLLTTKLMEGEEDGDGDGSPVSTFYTYIEAPSYLLEEEAEEDTSTLSPAMLTQVRKDADRDCCCTFLEAMNWLQFHGFRTRERKYEQRRGSRNKDSKNREHFWFSRKADKSSISILMKDSPIILTNTHENVKDDDDDDANNNKGGGARQFAALIINRRTKDQFVLADTGMDEELKFLPPPPPWGDENTTHPPNKKSVKSNMTRLPVKSIDWLRHRGYTQHERGIGEIMERIYLDPKNKQQHCGAQLSVSVYSRKLEN